MANIGICGECVIDGKRCNKRRQPWRKKRVACAAANEGVRCGGVIRKLPEFEKKKAAETPRERPIRTTDTRFETYSLRQLGDRRRRERP